MDENSQQLIDMLYHKIEYLKNGLTEIYNIKYKPEWHYSLWKKVHDIAERFLEDK